MRTSCLHPKLHRPDPPGQAAALLILNAPEDTPSQSALPPMTTIGPALDSAELAFDLPHLSGNPRRTPSAAVEAGMLECVVSLLSFRGVRKSYPDGQREHVVLEDVSFTIEAGEFVGVWGPRRSGKSTLLRIAAGVEIPDAGEVFYDGREITRLSADQRTRALRDEVGYFEARWSAQQNRHAIEHVAFAARADPHTTRRGARSMARRALQRVEMLECAERTLDSLSLGERVRVQLARALVRDPRLLLIDEPPPLHNPREGDDLYDLLKSLGDEPDRTVLIACGDVALVQQTQHMMSLSRGSLETMIEPEDHPAPKPAAILPFPPRRTATKP
jgi:ABC-type lipoprotein export system ATPase subunit